MIPSIPVKRRLISYPTTNKKPAAESGSAAGREDAFQIAQSTPATHLCLCRALGKKTEKPAAKEDEKGESQDVGDKEHYFLTEVDFNSLTYDVCRSRASPESAPDRKAVARHMETPDTRTVQKNRFHPPSGTTT
jgi:hypothetical protein